MKIKIIIFIIWIELNNSIVDRCNTNGNRFLCPNGKCAKNFDDCSEKFSFCKDDSKKKCQDGNCYKSCKGVEFNNCPFDKPFHCPDGRCVFYDYQCISFKCEINKPFLCQNNHCVKFINDCYDYQKLILINKLNISLKRKQTYPINENNTKLIIFEKLTEKSELDFTLAPFNLNNISQRLKFKYNKQFDILFKKIFKYHFNIHNNKLDIFYSPIFEIKNLNDKKNLLVNFKFTELYQNMKNIYCLAKINPNQNNLKCHEYFNQEINKFSGYRIKFKINSEGVYALILNINYLFENKKKEDIVYCGIICRHKIVFFKIIFLFLPLFLIFSIIFYKFYMLLITTNNLNDEHNFIKVKLNEIKEVNIDFEGQGILEKLDEGINYINNPLFNIKKEDLNKLKELNKEYSKKKIIFDNLKKEKKNFTSNYNEQKYTLSRLKTKKNK